MIHFTTLSPNQVALDQIDGTDFPARASLALTGWVILVKGRKVFDAPPAELAAQPGLPVQYPGV